MQDVPRSQYSLMEASRRRPGSVAWGWALALALGWAVSGCTTTSPATSSPTTSAAGPSKNLPRTRPKFVRAQVGDQVNIQWGSLSGVAYQIIYCAPPYTPGAWQPVPGQERVVGTGSEVIVSFTAPAPGRLRYQLLTLSPRPAAH